jgi:amino-acid N-acetyltransferase
MAKPSPGEPSVEREFFLEEFQGRSALVAIAPAVVASRPDLQVLCATVADLVRHGARVLIWWPSAGKASDRRLLAGLRRARAFVRRGATRRPAPLVRIETEELAAPAGDQILRGDLWSHLRQGRLCVLAVTGAVDFPRDPVQIATALRAPKVVLIDAEGGLRAGSARLSFVDENVLETLLQQGQAEWSGLGSRRGLLVAVRDALDGGVESVNLCSLEGFAVELFTYDGSGTLFTPDDYCQVAPLGLDEFAQAERLLERGQREGLLKLRAPEETAQLLAAGFGATICRRNLAGVAGLLTAPYAAERAGEIVGLYTITRFKGEGVGERLVRRLLEEAEAQSLAYVFACTIDEHAQQFFARLGFTRVTPRDVPPAKWEGYDRRRRGRLTVFRRLLSAAASRVRAS